MDRRPILLVAFACLAACAGGDTPTGNTGGTGGSTPTPVSVADGSFSPSNLTVTVNTVVRWTNAGNLSHTVTADDFSFNSGQIAGASSGGAYGTPTSGGSFQRTFAAAGTFAYHCTNHPGMTGTVTVTP